MKEKQMKISILIFFSLIINFCNSQIVKVVRYKKDANITVFETTRKEDANLIVWESKYKNDAKTPGVWFYTNYKCDAELVVFFVNRKDEANVIIYKTKYKNEAGWKKK